MSWNQWASAAPLPTANLPPQPPPIQPPTAAPPALPAAPPASPSFNYAAMSVEQQYAIQQNWQQWQAYQQQYAQWHAQYGEQYQREMQAKLGSTAPQLPYSGSVSSVQVPPPTMPPQPAASAPIPGYNQAMPPPANTNSAFLNAPPPPPEQDFQKFAQTNTNRPPPPPQENNSPQTPKNQNITPSNDQSSPSHGNPSNDKRNTFIENDYNFNKNSGNQDNFNKSSANQDNFNRSSANQDNFNRSSANQDNFNRSSANQDNFNRSSANQDNFNRSSANQDNYNRSSGDQDNFNRRSSHQDNYNRNSGNQDNFNRNSGNQDNFNRNSGNQDNFNRNSSNQDNFNRNIANQDNYNRNSGNQDNFGRTSGNQDNFKNKQQLNKGNNNQSYDRGFENQSKFGQNQRNFENQNQFNRSFENQQSQNQSRFSDNKRYEDNQMDYSSNEKSREEVLFDEQFKKWEEEFQNWKRANVNHPDRKAYREYEMKFEECRRKLVERREQMRKRKLEQMQKNIPQQSQNLNAQYKDDNPNYQQNKGESFNLPKQRDEEDPLEKEKIREALEKEKIKEALEKERLRESLEKERLRESLEKERLRETLEKERLLRESLEKERLKESLDKEMVRETLEEEMLRESLEKERLKDSMGKEKLKESLEDEVTIIEEKIDQDDRDENEEEDKKTSDEKPSEEFLTAPNLIGGIPGLDLVQEDKKIQKQKGETNEEIEVIDLEKQGDEELSSQKINWERNEADLDTPQNTNWMNQMSASQTKKIPSLFDMKIDKPNFSPPRKPFEPEEEFSEQKVPTPISTKEVGVVNQPVLNVGGVALPENITKALQDPSLLAILSTALKANAFNASDNNSLNNSFNNERMNVDDSNISNQSRDAGNDRNQQNLPLWENQDNRRPAQMWDNQDNRRQQDWLQRPDTSFLKFGNDFSNNMNQRGRFENVSSPWQSYDRNDNQGSGSNFYNDRRENERNRNSGGFGGRRYDDNDMNDNYNRDNDRDNRFNPFKRDHNDSRDSNDGRRERYDSDQDRNQNNNRGRDRERDSRNDNSGGGNNRNRNDRDRSDRSRSNNRSNRFDDNKDEAVFHKNDKSGGSSFNPFRRGESNSSAQGNNKNQSTSDEYFKPAQVIDYQNKPLKSESSPKDAFPLAKVVDYAHQTTAKQIDYGHKSSSSTSNINSKDTKSNDDYFPMRTIEYGHSSNTESTNKPPETKPQPEQKTSSSFGGGFGDFLASKGLSGEIGGGNSNKVEDYKCPLYKMNSGITLNNPESQPKIGLNVFSTSNHGNNYNLHSNRGIFNTHTNKNSSFANANNSSKYEFKNKTFENKNNKDFKNMLITDVDEISDADDDDPTENRSGMRSLGLPLKESVTRLKYFSEPKNSASTTPTNVKMSTSFSAYVDNFTTKQPYNVNENIMKLIPPPPPLISTDGLLNLKSSFAKNKPTYSYNHNNNQNDDLTHFNQNTFSNDIPCSTEPISSTTNCKQIFPSMENHNTITIDEILFKPGRVSRPKKMVLILRGPPGSGKSYIAKLIKEKEIEMKGSQPRILSIDDYFMNEVDKEGRCPKTNRKIIQQELIYEFDKDMEQKYIECLIKSFKKTLSEGLFNFVIVDCHNHSLRTFTEFYNTAKAENFTPYTIDLICDLEKCLENNIHKRDRNEIENIIKTWQETPEHYIKLDIKSLIKEIDIQEIEMEDAFDNISNTDPEETSQQSSNNRNDEFENDDENSVNESFKNIIKSKWDDTTEERLARLDGISKKFTKHDTIENYLQMDGWEPPSSSSNNKKRVRWADIEEKRAQDKMRAIGFVVGQTDWRRMMDPTGGSSALTKTKYIERINKSALRK